MSNRIWEYKKLPSYPHLSKHEAPIWEKFIDQYPDIFDSVVYDMTVGERRNDDTELATEWKRNADYLGKYKIDVIGISDNYITIVELKKEATTKAIGEVHLYEHLFRKEHDFGKILLTAIVTDEEMPNMREYTEANGVIFYVV